MKAIKRSGDRLSLEQSKVLFKRLLQGALVRSGASLIMGVIALLAYYNGIIASHHMIGVGLSILYLILMNPPTLWFLRKTRSKFRYKYFSLFINFLEIIGYTAIIYSLGGIEANYLTPIYAALITYVGAVSPRIFPYVVAALCSIAYSSMAVLVSIGLLPHQRVTAGFVPPPLENQMAFVSVVIALLFVTAYISAFTAGLIKKARDNLHQKNRELQAAVKEKETAERELKKAHVELEKRVSERTADLARVNKELEAEICERRLAEEALRESEARYRLHFENVSDVLYSIDLKSRVIDVSPSVKRVLGYRPEDLIGKKFQDLNVLAPEFMEQAIADAAGVLKGTQLESAHYQFIARDGKKKWGEVSSAAVIRDGRVVSLISVARDITERKEAEAERDKLQAQFLQAQKMESVGRLAGGVAHDFNNMLGAILGYTEIMLMDTKPEDPNHEYLLDIQTAAKRSADLARQLLAFARKQTISPKVLDLNDTVEGMLKMLRRLIGENIELAWEPHPHINLIKMDPAQIDQILVNLSVNARDAIGEAGRITIETENVVLNEAYCAEHPGSVPGEYVMFSVSDDGCGMDRENLDKIFEPFFTTKGVGKGTGLGLSTVYGIVKQNQGFIDVVSEPGRGTEFRTYIPQYKGKVEEQSATGEIDVPRARGETVVVVEDDAKVLNAGKMMLEKLGYNVLVANGPDEAVTRVENHAGEIHLLLTDVVMPRMNGNDLSGKIMEIRPEIKTLFMSGHTADIIAQQGVLKEGTQFIQKPFSYRDLALKAREALENT